MKKSKVFILTISFIIMILFSLYFLVYNTVNESVELEAGSEITADIFGKLYEDHTVFVEDISWIDNQVPGTYEVYVKNTVITHTCELVIVDTTLPEATGVDIEWYIENEIGVEDLLADVSDVTTLEYEILTEINYEDFTSQEVTIRITDLGDNYVDVVSNIKLVPLKEEVTAGVGEDLPDETAFIVGDVTGIVCITDMNEIDNTILQNIEIEFELDGEIIYSTLIMEDREAPVISCAGEEIRSILGEAIAYKQSITVTDNCDESIEIEFDNSEVDINTAGEYNLYCTATDLAGNTTSEVYTVVIYEQDSVEAEVYEMADAVLEKLIDDTMTEYEIVEAIYWYCKWNISYVGTSDKSDWITGAYNGLKYHSGDCFTYASVAKVLLTRAGITNMDISKIPAETEHYWNLVDIGEGWVHFDSCARADGTVIFLWTTEEVLEYSNANNLTHNYDPDEYPELYE